MKNNGTAYMIFVLGYDLLQKELTSYDDCPCNLAYEICCDIYDEFLDSEEAEQDKSESEGVSMFEIWCIDNLETEEQKVIMEKIKHHVDAISDVLCCED